MNIKLNPRLVAATAQFKASADIRYYLNGVYAEPIASGGVLLVATNGHAMCMWRDTEGTVDRPVILRTGTKLLSACAHKDAKLLHLVADRLTVTDRNNKELFVQPNREKWEIEGTFPDWKRVIPKTEAEPTLFDGINPSYVSLVTNSLRIAAGKEKWFGGISFNQPEKEKSIVVSSSNLAAENFVAVIMPLRESVSHQPKWVQELKGEAA